MKYKNIEVVSIVNFLNSISEKKLPQKISYAIMRNTSNFQKECNYYEQALKKILEGYKDFFVKKSDDELAMTSIGVPLVDNKHMEEYMEEIQELEEQVDQTERQLQESHVQRLTRGECTASAGMIFSDIISGLERVSDHATNIAFSLLEEPAEERKERRQAVKN